jgi:hypothetical protein
MMYVDYNPIVVTHAAALTATNDATHAVEGDLLDEVVGKAGKLLDLTQPVALLFAGCLHHILDSEDPAGIVAGTSRSSHRAASWSSRTPPTISRRRK